MGARSRNANQPRMRPRASHLRTVVYRPNGRDQPVTAPIPDGLYDLKSLT